MRKSSRKVPENDISSVPEPPKMRAKQGNIKAEKPCVYKAFRRFYSLVLVIRIELTTPSLPRKCSTAELNQHVHILVYRNFENLQEKKSQDAGTCVDNIPPWGIY